MDIDDPSEELELSAMYWQRKFRDLLESDEAEAAVMLLTTEDFSIAAKQRLVRIQRHIAKRHSAGRSTPRTTGRVVKAVTKTKSSLLCKDVKWSSILNMRNIDDPYFVQEHLDRYEWPKEYSKATAFLWDMPEPALLLSEPLRRGSKAPDGLNVTIPRHSTSWVQWIRGPRDTDNTPEVSAIKQNIERRMNFTYHAQRMTRVQQARELFTMLMWYDFVRCIWPDTTGSRIGSQMQKELIPIIQLFFKTSDKEKISKFCKDIATWSQIGRKLHETLCEPFGEASLFVLQEQLSPNFIENRMTLSGAPMMKARAHLKELGIESLTSRPSLRELARDIRRLLNKPFENITEFCKANAEDEWVQGT